VDVVWRVEDAVAEEDAAERLWLFLDLCGLTEVQLRVVVVI